MPARRISSLSMGVDEVTGAADDVFPVQASLFSSQRYGETAKDLLPFPACEILPKILIFEVCRFLIDEKNFGMQLTALIRVNFSWLDCNGEHQTN